MPIRSGMKISRQKFNEGRTLQPLFVTISKFEVSNFPVRVRHFRLGPALIEEVLAELPNNRQVTRPRKLNSNVAALNLRQPKGKMPAVVQAFQGTPTKTMWVTNE